MFHFVGQNDYMHLIYPSQGIVLTFKARCPIRIVNSNNQPGIT
jgi:hypothetical protein